MLSYLDPPGTQIALGRRVELEIGPLQLLRHVYLAVMLVHVHVTLTLGNFLSRDPSLC